MAIQLGGAYGKIELDASGVRRGVGQAQSALGGLRGSMQSAFSVATGFLAANIFQKAMDGMVGAVKGGLDVAMDYQSSMNMMQAVSGATEEQMAKVGQMAKKLGADMTLPATSAGDAAGAMTELAKAGLSVDEALAAAKGTLQLAAAGQVSEAAAAEIAANAINAWRNAAGEAALTGDDAVMVADLLAGAANASSGEVTDMADSLKMASAVFAAAGIPIEDTVAAIGEMSNAGIAGSDAGTSLKQMLLSLQAPTDKSRKLMAQMGVEVYDSQGQMRDFRDIIGGFNKGLEGLTQEQRNQALATIFGSDAVRAANVVLGGGVEAFDKMKGAVTKEGAAAELAGARMKGLRGAIEGMKSQVETALLTLAEPMLGPLEEGMRGFADVIGGEAVMGRMGEVGAQIGQSLAKGLASAGAAMKKLPALIGRGVALVEPILTTLRDTIVKVLDSPEMAKAGSMVGAALHVFADWAETAWPVVSVTIQGVIGRIRDLIQGSLLPTFTMVVAKIGAFFSENGPLINHFLAVVGGAISQLVVAIQGAWPVIDALLGGIIDLVLGIGKSFMQMVTGDWKGAFKTMEDAQGKAWDAIKRAFGAFINWVLGWFGSSVEEIQAGWQSTWDRFGATVWLAWNSIHTQIEMTMSQIWTKIRGTLYTIQATWDRVWDGLKSAVDGLKKGLDKFVKFLEEKVSGPLLWFVTNVLKPIKRGFDDIISAAQFLLGVVDTLVNNLKKIKLPDPFNPGSPTPFELGLRGISAAMQNLAGTDIPNMQGRLAGLGGAMPALATAGGGGGTGYYDYRRYESPVNVTATVASELDIETLAYRLASMIRSKQR